jgi:hypothetical protein
MTARSVRVEFRTPLPVPVDSLAPMEALVTAALKAHGVPASEATMRQDGPDLVMFYDTTIEEDDDDDE